MGMVKPSIVIPLSKSTCDFIDLKYCLRSIDKYVKGYENIIIIGEKPKGIKGIGVLPFHETFSEVHKDRNILGKIQYACIQDRITEDFVFMNDDHIFTKETDITNYPFYHKGELTEALNSTGTYKLTMRHTLEYLQDNAKSTFNYDTHCPIIYNKQKFLATFEPIDFDIPFGYGIKSMYGNLNDVEGEYMPDCKFTGKNTKEEVRERCVGRHIISCNETSLRHGLGDYLKEILPHKSIFE